MYAVNELDVANVETKQHVLSKVLSLDLSALWSAKQGLSEGSVLWLKTLLASCLAPQLPSDSILSHLLTPLTLPLTRSLSTLNAATQKLTNGAELKHTDDVMPSERSPVQRNYATTTLLMRSQQLSLQSLANLVVALDESDDGQWEEDGMVLEEEQVEMMDGQAEEMMDVPVEETMDGAVEEMMNGQIEEIMNAQVQDMMGTDGKIDASGNESAMQDPTDEVKNGGKLVGKLITEGIFQRIVAMGVELAQPFSFSPAVQELIVSDIELLQLRTLECLNVLFGTLTVTEFNLMQQHQVSVDEVFERYYDVVSGHTTLIVAAPSDPPMNSIRVVDDILSCLWSLGRVTIDQMQTYPAPPSQCSILDHLIQFYETMAPLKPMAGLRMKVISVLGVLASHPNLNIDTADRVGTFLLRHMEDSGHGMPRETQALALAELVNAFLDVFGPDTHNQLFDTRHLVARIRPIPQLLKNAMKHVDPRKEKLDGDLVASCMAPRLVRERMHEMYVNMKRFVAYKESCDRKEQKGQ